MMLQISAGSLSTATEPASLTSRWDRTGVPGLAELEGAFPADHMVLCFGSVATAALLTHQCFSYN